MSKFSIKKERIFWGKNKDHAKRQAIKIINKEGARTHSFKSLHRITDNTRCLKYIQHEEVKDKAVYG